MTDRIKNLVEKTLRGEMYVTPIAVEYKYNDSLSESENDVIALCRYIEGQAPHFTEHSAFTGRFNFDGSVIGDAFKRGGHRHTQKALDKYYLKPQENLSTMEWQHATADYQTVLDKGILGIIDDIDASLLNRTEKSERAFLSSLKKVANSIIKWCEKCSCEVEKYSQGLENGENKVRLLKLSSTIAKVPKNKPTTFYEAVLCIYVCFSADPDSVGTLDRYLYPFYINDIQNGTLTEDMACEYLQELFLMLQASTPKSSPHFTRGGESHFCIGGYLPNGEDGFSRLSYLIAKSMVELPTYIPQLTLRWTKKLKREDFVSVMELERRDPHKRIAFTNDEKRLKCYTEICKIPFERAVGYTMVGCNEPAFLGAITGSTSKINILRHIDRLFHAQSYKLEGVKTFDEFYEVVESEMFYDIDLGLKYDDMFNTERAKDINYISSLFFDGCVENAKSLTQGGGKTCIASPMLIGITNLIDSIIAVKQIVFDRKEATLLELCSAIKSNWQGNDHLRTLILRTVDWFGTANEGAQEVAKRVYNSLYNFYKDRKTLFGYQFLVGDLLGYNEHHKWFGELTGATPDGRCDGDMLKFGISQSQGRDKDGLLHLLSSVATLDENAIGCGATVTNISLDGEIVNNDDSFYKLCSVLEGYFKMGGVHFQLTYVSKDDLLNAQKSPEDYASLRVRVTGFSDYFVKLKPSIQNDIIERTEHKK